MTPVGAVVLNTTLRPCCTSETARSVSLLSPQGNTNIAPLSPARRHNCLYLLAVSNQRIHRQAAARLCLLECLCLGDERSQRHFCTLTGICSATGSSSSVVVRQATIPPRVPSCSHQMLSAQWQNVTTLGISAARCSLVLSDASASGHQYLPAPPY